MLIANTHINPKFFLMIRNAQNFHFFSFIVTQKNRLWGLTAAFGGFFCTSVKFLYSEYLFRPIYSTTFDLEIFPVHAVCHQATIIDKESFSLNLSAHFSISLPPTSFPKSNQSSQACLQTPMLVGQS